MSVDLDLCYTQATEALRRFKGKTVSPVELAVIVRAEAASEKINASIVGVPAAIKNWNPVNGENSACVL